MDTLPRPSARTRAFAFDASLILGFATLTALLAQIRISLSFTPVPITGQTLAILLAGAVLGWKRGALSQLAYWTIGVIAPIAWYANDSSGSSITAGWRIATGTTAGYLAGFVAAAAIVGLLAERGQDRTLLTSLPAMLTCTAVIYLFGVTWLAIDLAIPVFAGDPNAVALGLTPFLPGDLIKLAIAGALTPAAWRLVRR